MQVQDYCFFCCQKKGRLGGCADCGPTAQGRPTEGHPNFLPPLTILAGQYIVGRVLGHGGFGITYLGLDANLEFRVAIKEFIPKDLASRNAHTLNVIPYSQTTNFFEDGIKKFMEEGQQLAKFDHPNIVRVLNFFKENGTCYLVMRYIEGQTLEDIRLQRGGILPQEEVVTWTEHALNGLKAVHDVGMLHRDIKPHNIYLTTQGEIKLLDFGAARTVSGKKSANLTQLWTPGFAPPEQCGGTDEEQGPWTDTYAMGATMYALLTGEMPIDSVFRIRGTPLPSPQELLGFNIRSSFSNVIMQALELTPSKRFPSAMSFLQALRDAKTPQGYHPPPPRPSKPSAIEIPAIEAPAPAASDSFEEHLEYPPRKQGWGSIFLGMLLLASVMAGFLWFVKSSKQPSTPPQTRIARLTPNPRAPSVPRLPVFQMIRQAAQAANRGEYAKAASLYNALGREQPKPFPQWRLSATEVAMRARAGQLAQAKELLAQALREYDQWKKQRRERGASLHYYIRMDSHAAFGEAYWQLAEASTGSERLAFLGELWMEWPISRRAEQAQVLWWNTVSSSSFSTHLSTKQMLNAANTYRNGLYRRIERAVALLRSYLLTSPSPYSTIYATYSLIQIYLQQRNWSEAKQLAETLLERYGQKRKYKKRLYRARRYLAISQFYLGGGLAAFQGVFSQYPEDATDARIEAMYSLAYAQMETGQFREAIHSLQWVQSRTSSAAKKVSIPWYIGFLRYALKEYQQAYQELDALRLKTSEHTHPERALSLLYWTATAAAKAGLRDQANTRYQQACTQYPLSYAGMLSCKELGKAPAANSSSDYGLWTPYGEAKTRYLAVVQHEDRKSLEIELTRQIYEQTQPEPGLIDRAAEAYAQNGNWGISFQMLKSHRLKAIWAGQLSRKMYAIAFPRPPQVWGSIARVAHSYSIEPTLVAAVVRREGDFHPEERFASRVGIMGLDPVWTSLLPSSLDENLKIGVARLARLGQQFGSALRGATVYRGGGEALKRILQNHPNVPPEVLWYVFPSLDPIYNYAYSQENGILWYHRMYQWLSP